MAPTGGLFLFLWPSCAIVERRIALNRGSRSKQRFSRFPAFIPFVNEAQTEGDWVRPVLELLGHTYEVQAQLKMPGAVSPQHPDYVLYASADQQLALKERGAWEEFLDEQRAEVARLTGQIVGLEQQLNRAVYAVFGLHEDEIALVERETKYQDGEW